MWKDTTGRKVLVPVERKRGLLSWSAIPLALALVAAFFSFLGAAPEGLGLARWTAVFFAAVFVVLLVAGLLQQRRSP